MRRFVLAADEYTTVIAKKRVGTNESVSIFRFDGEEAEPRNGVQLQSNPNSPRF
jgi:hypothetical protein